MKNLVNMQDKKLNENLNNGAVIGFETDTVWGIGALPFCKKGIDSIYEIKNRDRSKPLILMSNDIKNLLPFVKPLSPKAEEIVNKYFPGALTLIFEKSEITPNYITNYMNTVGIRVPNHEGFKKLCEKIEGHVLATTSANISNQKTSVCRRDVEKSIGDKLYKIFGNDTNIEKVASTIVCVDKNDKIKVLRQGSIYFKDSI